MCLLIGVNQLGFGAIVPVLPLYASSFDVSQAAIGSTIAVYGVARLMLGLPAGRLADWLGRRSVLALGGLVAAGGNLWCALATTFPELIVARFVAGAGAGLTLTAGIIVLADISTPARRGRVMAIYQGVFLFAVGIGPLPGGYLAQTWGLDVPFLVCGAASAVAALLGWFGISETRPDTSAQGTDQAGPLPYFQQLKQVLQPVGFRLVCSIGFINALVRTGGLFAIIPIVGTSRLGLSATEIGFSMAFGSIAGVLLTYPAGMLVDFFGRKAVIVPATVVTGIAFITFGLADDYFWFIVASGIWGIASSVSGAAPSAYAADISPTAYTATAMSSFRTLSDVGYVVGPILLGIIADEFGLTAPLFLGSCLLFAVALAFARFAPETLPFEKRHQEEKPREEKPGKEMPDPQK
ncbi:MAG: MFS transporter [Pseudomonadales bacterium]|nr:MFS transporter [Pseudomonadales bacterium]